MRVHLLTISPGDTLVTSMGHTALAFSGGGMKQPAVYDWGAYDASSDNALAKVAAGELVYFLRVKSFGRFYAKVKGRDRTLVGQVLDIPSEETHALQKRIEALSHPLEREYKYHWADANCATKVRDALDEATHGALAAGLDRPVPNTARFEANRHFHRWPAIGFGWRFIISNRVDQPLTAWQRTMLPEHLMRDVGQLTVSWDGAEPRPLVKTHCDMRDGGFGFAPKTPPARWPWALPGLLVSVLVLLSSSKVNSNRRARRWTGTLAGVYGLALALLGTVGFALWALTAIDGLGPTQNWLLAGPQTWVLVWAGDRFARGKQLGAMLQRALMALGALGLLGLALWPVTLTANGDMLSALLPGLLASIVALLWAGGGDDKAVA